MTTTANYEPKDEDLKVEQLDYEFLAEALREYYFIRVKELVAMHNLSNENQVIFDHTGGGKFFDAGKDPYVSRLVKQIKILEIKQKA